MKIAIAIIVIVLLVAIFFISYVLNNKTPKPDGCRDLIEEGNCQTCKVTDCALKIVKKEKEALEKENE